jgi:hypothetical protein
MMPTILSAGTYWNKIFSERGGESEGVKGEGGKEGRREERGKSVGRVWEQAVSSE